MVRRTVVSIAAGSILALGLAGSALAGTGNPSGTGQPNQECEDVRPGNAASASGSAFNPGPGTAGQNYAGEKDVNTGHPSSTDPKSVSQYDVACTKQP